jgi:hypothetical protein
VKSLTQQIVELIDAHTDKLCPHDTFVEAGAALAEAVEVIDARYANHALAEGVMDCLDALKEGLLKCDATRAH